MRVSATLAVALASACAIAAPGHAQELRIGFLTNFTAPGALQGIHQRGGWTIGLEHEGWKKDGDKLGGVPMRVFYGDDQAKPDLGLREIDKWLNAEKVQIVAGYLWSNVLMASRKPLVDAKRVFMSTIPGPSPLAGKECTPYFISVAQNNDTVAEATGQMANADNIQTVLALAPNYQAGKDMIAGFQRTYKGKLLDQQLFKLGETDFQAEITKLRAAKPQAIFIFAPGAMGIAFAKQWAASGAGAEIKVYSVFTVDHLTLPAIGDAANGTFHAGYWDADSPLELNRTFVREYVARFNHFPSMFAVPAYDMARMIAAAVKSLDGKVDDPMALAKALRHVSFPSLRGEIKFNVNGYVMQDHYKFEVVKGPDGKAAIKNTGLIFKLYKDAYWEQCPPENRL